MLKKLLILGSLLALGLLALPAAGGLGWRAWRQHQTSEAMAIHFPNGIDERRQVRIGGVDQWITIRGQNRRNPAIPELHGGPGAPVSALPSHFLHWERDFTVIQGDQRGAGERNDVVAYAGMLAKARARHNNDGVRALEDSGPPPYRQIRQMGAERQWAMRYEPGLRFGPSGPSGLLAELVTAPDYSLKVPRMTSRRPLLQKPVRLN
jgi:hypothetical protein